MAAGFGERGFGSLLWICGYIVPMWDLWLHRPHVVICCFYHTYANAVARSVPCRSAYYNGASSSSLRHLAYATYAPEGGTGRVYKCCTGCCQYSCYWPFKWVDRKMVNPLSSENGKSVVFYGKDLLMVI